MLITRRARAATSARAHFPLPKPDKDTETEIREGILRRHGRTNYPWGLPPKYTKPSQKFK